MIVLSIYHPLSKFPVNASPQAVLFPISKEIYYDVLNGLRVWFQYTPFTAEVVAHTGEEIIARLIAEFVFNKEELHKQYFKENIHCLRNTWQCIQLCSKAKTVIGGRKAYNWRTRHLTLSPWPRTQSVIAAFRVEQARTKLIMLLIAC
jgi:hypothetical protein